MDSITHSAALLKLTGKKKFTRRLKRKLFSVVRGFGPLFLPRFMAQRGRTGRLRRIALVVKGNTSHPSTAHIRLLRPLYLLAERFPIDVHPVKVNWLLEGGIAKVDAVIVQRDALPAAATDALLESLRVHGVPMLYEIDDWLWNIPQDHCDHGIREEHRASMRKLIQAATSATVSTDQLVDILRQDGCPAIIVPNGLDETLWASPLPASFVADIGTENGLSKKRPTLLYMGTVSHAEDLKVVVPAVEQLRMQYPELDIVQIGGGTMLPGGREIQVPYEAGEYPDFVLWFRGICAYATLAIAPLRDNEFNSAKSDIKTLDYGFGLVPAVYSNVGPYRRSVVDGETGLLCDNETGAWYRAMSTLLNDTQLRARITAGALAAAEGRGLSRQGVSQWQAILSELFAKVPKVASLPAASTPGAMGSDRLS
jgi:glycosyltransferase involved in cell wall biosynthesis